MLTVELPENLLGGFYPVVLGFFEDGDAAEIRIGEEDPAVEAREAAAFLGEDRADGGADHGVAHAHYLDARDTLADVRMDALEVVKDGFLPERPIFFEEELAALRRSASGERMRNARKAADAMKNARSANIVDVIGE